MRKSLNLGEVGQIFKPIAEEKAQASKSNNSSNQANHICSECQPDKITPALYFCPDCKDEFCEDCNKAVHAKGRRAEHKRVKIEIETESEPETYIIVDIRELLFFKYDSLLPNLKKDIKEDIKSIKIIFIIKKDGSQNALKKILDQGLKGCGSKVSYDFENCDSLFSTQKPKSLTKLYILSHINNNTFWEKFLPEWLKSIVTSGKAKAFYKTIKPSSSKNIFQEGNYVELPSNKWSLFSNNEEYTYEFLQQKLRSSRLSNETTANTNNYDSANSKNSREEEEEKGFNESGEFLRTVTKERQPVQPESDFERTNQKNKHLSIKKQGKDSIEPEHSNFNSSSTSARLNQSLPDTIEFMGNISISFLDRSLNNSMGSIAGMNAPVNPIPIEDLQAHKADDVNGCLMSSICIQNFLRSFAEKGDLMILKSTFESELYEELLKKNLIKNSSDFSKLLENAEAKNLFHITKRKFGDSDPISYVSMQLETLSLQAIVWVMYSLRKDEMTPNEKVLLSRIKESYAMKISQITWQGILLYIYSLCNEFNTIQRENLPSLKVIKTSEAKEGGCVESLHIFFNEGEWKTNDQGSLDSSDEKLWDDFLEYIDEFFNERDESKGSRYSEKSKKYSDKGKWSSSVENILTKSNTKKMVFYPPRSSSRAIPGGRYGAAQLIKCCGPEKLNKYSLGKLSLLVQESIDRQILVYHKTLLIRSNNPQVNKSLTEKVKVQITEVPLTPEKQAKLAHIKSTIEEIVRENPNGIALARLPRILQSKLSFPYDCHEFGFTKLKHLLMSLDSLTIENPGTTYATAKLNKKAVFNRDASLPEIKTMLNSFRKSKNHSDNNIESYKERVDLEIMKVLSEYTFPIEIKFLYENLSKKLLHDFDFTIFNSQSFEEYLNAYLRSKVRLIKREDNSTLCISSAQTQSFLLPHQEPKMNTGVFQVPYFTSMPSPPGLTINQGNNSEGSMKGFKMQYSNNTDSCMGSNNTYENYSGVYYYDQGVMNSSGSVYSNNISNNNSNSMISKQYGNFIPSDSDKSLMNMMKNISEVNMNQNSSNGPKNYYGLPPPKNLSATNSHSGGHSINSIPSVKSTPIQNLKYTSNSYKDKSYKPAAQPFIPTDQMMKNNSGVPIEKGNILSLHIPDNFSDNFSQSQESLHTMKTILNQSSVPFTNSSDNIFSSESKLITGEAFEDSNLPDLKFFVEELLDEKPSKNFEAPGGKYPFFSSNPSNNMHSFQSRGPLVNNIPSEARPQINIKQMPFQYIGNFGKDVVPNIDNQNYFSQRPRGQSDY